MANDPNLSQASKQQQSEQQPEVHLDPLLQQSGVAEQDFPAGALYVVATPIGNVADLTLRALWVLSHVDAIAAEDTRVTRALLDRYGIRTPASGVFAAHQHNEQAAAQRVVELLRAGARVALVSDAGTPAISDPGARLAHAVLEAGLRVLPIPGVSALAAAVSAAGLSGSALHFIGFLPNGAKERARVLRAAAQLDAAIVLYEAPHRLRDTAREFTAVFSADRRVVVARELTKKFETIAALRASELAAYVEANEPRGEYVLLIDAEANNPAADEQLDAATLRWLHALADVLPASRAAAVAAKATGLKRDVLYRALLLRDG